MRIAKLEATFPHYTIKQYINALGEELMNWGIQGLEIEEKIFWLF